MTKKNPNPDNLTNLPDHRAMEGFMHEMFAQRNPTPVDEAQDIMYQAWDCSDPAERIALARNALEVSEDCADAWVLLAEEGASSVEEIQSFFEKGVAAGERALGAEVFAEGKGHFWGLLETRPYMRARFGLAQYHWATGARDQAMQGYRYLLELNPNDNQGVRYHLLSALLESGQHDAVRELLQEYEEEMSAWWAYSRVLLSYREQQDRPGSRELRRRALACNRYVPAYLAGRRKIPKTLPNYIGCGDKNEAIAYVVDNRQCWLDTPGAIGWLLKGKG